MYVLFDLLVAKVENIYNCLTPQTLSLITICLKFYIVAHQSHTKSTNFSIKTEKGFFKFLFTELSYNFDYVSQNRNSFKRNIH